MKVLLFILCTLSSAYAIDARSVIPAGSYQEKNNPTSSRPNGPGPGAVGYIDNDSWLKYTQVDFGSQPVESISIRASSGGSGGTVNVRLGSSTGHLLSSVTVPNTGGWHITKTFRSAITHPAIPVTGMKDLVLEFVGGGGDLFNVENFVFDTSMSWKSDVLAGEFLRESHPGDDTIIKKEGDDLKNATQASWVDYGIFDFGAGMNYLWIDVATSTAIQPQNPRRIEFRTDSLTGNLIGTLEIPNTNGVQKPLGLKLPQPVSGTKKLFLSFSGPEGEFFNVKKFRFQHLAPDHKPAFAAIPRIQRDPQVTTWTPAAPFSLEDPPSNMAPPPPAGDNTDVRPVGSRVEWISPNTWVKYTGHHIVTGANRISIVAASPISGGGNIELRVGSSTATPLATLNIQSDWWNNYRVFTAKIPTPPAGPQDVFFRFTGAGGYVLNFESFRFYNDPLISASSNADRSSGIIPVTVNSDEITGLTNNSWVRYDGVNFSQSANLITVSAATPNKGGAVQIRLDSPTGPHIATVDVTHTGSFTNFREFPERLLQPITGVRTVYLSFVDTHNEGINLFNLKGLIIETKSEHPPTPTHQGTLALYPQLQASQGQLELARSPYYTYSIQKVSDLNATLKQNATNWQNPFAWFSEGKVAGEPYSGWYYGWISGWSHTYCNFELGKNTPIVVKISRTGSNPHGAPIGPIFMANAHPANKVQSCEIINGDVYVTMSEPALVTVDIDGQLDARDNALDGTRVNGAHAVSIFANPVIHDKPTAPPTSLPTSGSILYVGPGDNAKDKMNSRNDWNILYFLPGVHSLFGFENDQPKPWEPGLKCQLSSEKTVYIPGDAIVYGCFDSKDGINRNNLRVYGHGTLSGRYVPHLRDASWWNRNGTHPNWGKDRDGVDGLTANYENSPIQMNSMTNCLIEGITVADPAFHAISADGGSGNTRRWLKQVSWRSNSDMGGVNGIVEDGFYRIQDDGVYVSGSDFRRNTLWFDVNGQAYRGSFITAGAFPESHQTVIEDCDIIYVRSMFGGGALMGSGDFWDGGGGQGSGTYPDGTKNTAQHVIFRNIRVTDPRPERSLFGFSVPSGNPNVGGIAGIRFENIELRHPQARRQRNQFSGTATAPVHHLYFDSVTIEGKKLDAALMSDSSLFDPLVNTANFVFRDASNPPVVVIPPTNTTIDTSNNSRILDYNDPQNTYIGNGSLQLSSNGSSETTIALGTNSGVQSTNFAMTGGMITINTGVTLLNGGWKKGNWSSNKASMLINGTLDLWDGNPVFVDALSGQGKVVFEDQWDWNARGLNVGVNGGSGTFSGEIEAPGSVSYIQLIKWGSGTQTLDNLANQKPGEIMINQGSVNLAANSAVTVASSISGAGNLIKSGTGVVSLSGMLTYLGNTTVVDGTLSISQPPFANTSTVTIGQVEASSAVLNLPNAGTRIVSQLIIDGVTQSGNGAVYDSLNSSGAITGLGKIQVGLPITYSLAVTSGINGSISWNPSGIAHHTGTMITLTATPSVGYKLDFWSGDLSGTTNPVAITMNSNKSVTATFSRIRVLLVVGDVLQMTSGSADLAIHDRLLGLGYDVQAINDELTTNLSGTGKTLIMVSSTVGSSNIGIKFQGVAVPVINWETALQDEFLFTPAANQGILSEQTALDIVNASHPLAAGLASGARTVATSADIGGFSWGVPGGSPMIIARLSTSGNQPCIYAYETGAAMNSGTAPARRVHLFLQNNTFTKLNADGRKLFDAAFSWAMDIPASSHSFISAPTAEQEYSTWAANRSMIGGMNDDDDHDNLSNFTEYSFGLQPGDPSSVNPIVVPLSAIDGTFSYSRRKTESATMDYSIWYATMLAHGGWSKDMGAVQGPPVVQGETETVPVRVSSDLLNHSKLFIQVRATTGAQE